MRLFNTYSPEDLRKRLEAEAFSRVTLSFYRYVRLHNLDVFRNHLYEGFESLGVLGRVYLAHEGINAQVSVPGPSLDAFAAMLEDNGKLRGMYLNRAVEQGRSFLKLIVRIRPKIVADGLDDGAFDVSDVGRHLTPAEFHRAMADPATVVIDMRNQYESEVGHFENAILPAADTFRDALPEAVNLARGMEDRKILLYCTGGIRCEKASAYFRHHGFADVNQLQGGIITYAHEMKRSELPSKFIGKNFVFDGRLGERITDDVIGRCHQCGQPADTHTNCANPACHLLFIQCGTCRDRTEGCCSAACREALSSPETAPFVPVSLGTGRKNIHNRRRSPRLNTA